MVFLTNDDFAPQVRTEILSILQTSATALDIIEREAVEEISQYISARYDTTAIFSAVASARSPLIVMYMVDIILYHLSASATTRQVSELRKDRYDNAISALKYVAKGLSNPPLPLLTNGAGATVSTIRFGSKKKDENGF